jgi:hypothetical protein
LSPEDRGNRRWSTIRCTACGWRKRVVRSKAAGEILYHRDVTCAARVDPPAAPSTRGTMSPKRRGVSRVGGRRPKFCATCRGELSRINDAMACLSGCTVRAIDSG